MMNARLATLNFHLKIYDRDLFAVMRDTGVYHIMRKGFRWESYSWGGKTLTVLRDSPDYILSLTKNWRSGGTPVEWGIEPIMQELKSRDNWRDDSQYERMVKNRERQEAIKEQSATNDRRALAADMRRDFARATNDINTASLKKIDRRRLKDGNRK